MSGDWVLHEGDCLEALGAMPDASVDACVTDPPYPGIKRPYGEWTEAEWFALMDEVVPQVRRVLKPAGSAVFILQPNSERNGRMRTWLLEFTLKWAKAWGWVQDAYWWNTSALVLAGANKAGLMRPSLKHAVWLGPPDCYRDQDSCLLTESEANRTSRLRERFEHRECPSRRRSPTEGPRDDQARMCSRAGERGGTAPFNLMPLGSDGRWSGGTDGHGASTPLTLCRWWVRYLCPRGGVVLDPFCGSGTVGVACLAEGRGFVGAEKEAAYAETARRRMREAEGPLFADSRKAAT